MGRGVLKRPSSKLSCRRSEHLRSSSALHRSVLGQRLYRLGSSKLGRLLDSTALANKLRCCRDAADNNIRNLAKASSIRKQLQARLHSDGYLYVKGLLPKDIVHLGRTRILDQFQKLGLLDSNFPLDEARFTSGAAAAGQIGSPPEVLEILNSDTLLDFLDDVFEHPVETVFQPNLRSVPPGKSSGFHVDSVYMGGLMHPKLPRITACWIPLQHIPVQLGGLVVCRGSNSSIDFDQVHATYSRLDLDQSDISGPGWFTEDPEDVTRFGGRWETAEFGPGDVVLFTMHTFHGSSKNQTQQWRLSLDFRFRPAPSDDLRAWEEERLARTQHLRGRHARLRHDPSEFPRTMDMAKVAWGLIDNAGKTRATLLRQGLRMRLHTFLILCA